MLVEAQKGPVVATDGRVNLDGDPDHVDAGKVDPAPGRLVQHKAGRTSLRLGHACDPALGSATRTLVSFSRLRRPLALMSFLTLLASLADKAVVHRVHNEARH